MAARLCHAAHVLMENRHGLVVDISVSEANGYAEREEALELVRRARKRHGLEARTLAAGIPGFFSDLLMPRFLHVPRTGGSSIVQGWVLVPPEYRGHSTAVFAGEGWRYGLVRNPWGRVVSLYHMGYSGRTSFRDYVLTRLGKHPWLEHPATAWLECADWIGRFETREQDLAEVAELLGREVPADHAGASHNRRPYPEYYDDETRARVADHFRVDIETFGYPFGEVC